MRFVIIYYRNLDTGICYQYFSLVFGYGDLLLTFTMCILLWGFVTGTYCTNLVIAIYHRNLVIGMIGICHQHLL